jgi:hypothetical protein
MRNHWLNQRKIKNRYKAMEISFRMAALEQLKMKVMAENPCILGVAIPQGKDNEDVIERTEEAQEA